MNDLETRLHHSLQRVAQATAVPPAPTVRRAAAAAPGRSRWRTVALVCAALVPTTGALVAAGDLLPGSVRDAFSFSQDFAVDSATLQLRGTLPVPGGRRFELWTRTGDSETCFLSALVSAETAPSDSSAPTRESSGMCTATDGTRAPFGVSGGGSGETFSYDVGAAVRAEVLLPDGSRLPTVIAAGQVAGWLPDPVPAGARLVGYDASGTVVGTADLPPFGRPTH